MFRTPKSSFPNELIIDIVLPATSGKEKGERRVQEREKKVKEKTLCHKIISLNKWLRKNSIQNRVQEGVARKAKVEFYIRKLAKTLSFKLLNTTKYKSPMSVQ